MSESFNHTESPMMALTFALDRPIVMAALTPSGPHHAPEDCRKRTPERVCIR